MEEQVEALVQKTWAKYQTLPQNQRLLIAVSGIPGSGKTTLAKSVTNLINGLSSSTPPGDSAIASFIPMDGYHYSRAHLSSMSDPQNAHARRGAEFTFDGASYLTLVQKLRTPISPSSTTIYAPSFDHALKDPVESDISIPPSSRILIFEGLYLSLDKSPWKEAARLMDELWFVEVDFEIAGARLAKRHVRAGLVENEEAGWRRARENDLVNGQQIVDNRLGGISEVVRSREDERWKDT